MPVSVGQLPCSSLTVAVRDGVYRLTTRLPDGIEEILVKAISDANSTAGSHLSKALRETTTMNGKPSHAMTEASGL